VASTARPEVLGGIGGFGGCFAFDPSRFRQPVLVASTDGVGTKVLVAQAAGRFDTSASTWWPCASTTWSVGAEPLFLLDYIVTGQAGPDQMEALVGGGRGLPAGRLRPARRRDGRAPRGHGARRVRPGRLRRRGGRARERCWGWTGWTAGDVLVGLASPGLRSNGYTLARHVLLERAGLGPRRPGLAGRRPQPGRRAAAALGHLRPASCWPPSPLGAVHAAAHITGGGITGNLPRVLPPARRRGGAGPVVTPYLSEIQRLGDVDDDEMARVFNLGVGMVLVVAADAVVRLCWALSGAGQEAGRGGSGRRGDGPREDGGRVVRAPS
jgi:phosphoribosylformylglycinamidine cyclo-ligase